MILPFLRRGFSSAENVISSNKLLGISLCGELVKSCSFELFEEYVNSVNASAKSQS